MQTGENPKYNGRAYNNGGGLHATMRVWPYN
jgi:hypothetical protein